MTSMIIVFPSTKTFFNIRISFSRASVSKRKAPVIVPSNYIHVYNTSTPICTRIIHKYFKRSFTRVYLPAWTNQFILRVDILVIRTLRTRKRSRKRVAGVSELHFYQLVNFTLRQGLPYRRRLMLGEFGQFGNFKYDKPQRANVCTHIIAIYGSIMHCCRTSLYSP